MRRAIFLMLMALTTATFAQTDSLLRENAIKVYLDGAFLDEQFIKDNLTFVNYVRDHHDADVYILIVRENSGSGGERYTLIFEGQNKYQGRNDTLRFNTKPDETTDETRRTLLKYLKAGLTPFVANTPLFDYMDIAYKAPTAQKQQVVEDKWHSWVFDLGVHGYASGQTRYKDLSLSGSVSASKVTPDWIIDLSADYSFSKSRYVITDDYIVNSLRRSASFDGLVVRSLSDHWSAGTFFESGQSTYSNYRLYASLSPAVEFNIFPYSESTVHQLRILYAFGARQNYYVDTTIYNKLQELYLRQRLSVAYQVRKKWGSVNISLDGSTFVPDFSKNSLSASTSLSVRLFKGFSVNTSFSYGFVHDQVNLPKGDATLEEILTQQQQLATSFRYWGFFGISYTFGAIYNNVVNPRFGHSGGSTMIIMY